jgi:hypothetical protein
LDPGAIGSAQWSEIGSLLANLWLVVLSIVLFASNVLIGVNSIPSLTASGHLPESIGKVRPLFYALALLFFGAAVFFLIRVIDKADVLRDFWPNYWI